MIIDRVSESQLRIVLADTIDTSNIARLQTAARRVQQALGEAFDEVIIAYASLLVSFDVLQLSPFDAIKRVQYALQDLHNTLDSEALCEPSNTVIELPVYYHPEVAPDLLAVANACGLSVDEVIRLHSETLYRVFALGFSPGFAFMGELNSALQLPRHNTPRQQVAKGSVAIAQRQTAVYPAATPGGWHIIGRCPQVLFDVNKTPPNYLKPGDSVRFVAITRDAFLQAGGVLDG